MTLLVIGALCCKFGLVELKCMYMYLMCEYDSVVIHTLQ